MISVSTLKKKKKSVDFQLIIADQKDIMVSDFRDDNPHLYQIKAKPW